VGAIVQPVVGKVPGDSAGKVSDARATSAVGANALQNSRSPAHQMSEQPARSAPASHGSKPLYTPSDSLASSAVSGDAVALALHGEQAMAKNSSKASQGKSSAGKGKAAPEKAAPENKAAAPADPSAQQTAGEAALKEALSKLSAKPAGAASGNAASGHQTSSKPESDTVFTKPTPSGAAKKISEVLGEIVWLMSQSPAHKQFFIADLEWFAMTPIVLQQFRLFYDETKPIGCVLWGSVNEEVEQRLISGTPRLRPQEWKSGDRLWVVEIIAPFGGSDEMVKDLKAKVFKDRELKFLMVGTNGKEVRAV
jgi:cytolysin-activating lysine-acyltransferase